MVFAERWLSPSYGLCSYCYVAAVEGEVVDGIRLRRPCIYMSLVLGLFPDSFLAKVNLNPSIASLQ